MTSGGGASNLNEMLGSMNMPRMHDICLHNLKKILAPGGKDEIEKASAEEKRIAKEKTFS